MDTKIVLHQTGAGAFAELLPTGAPSQLGEDPNALISFAWENDAAGLLIHDTALSAKFFDLKSGVAGEALQKLVNYNCKTAFVMSDLDAEDIRVRELAHDHRRHPMVQFFSERDLALAWLSS